MKLVADDGDIRPARLQRALRLAADVVAEAVVLVQQIHLLHRVVAPDHVRERVHAHAGVRIEAKVPETAGSVGQRGIVGGIVEEDDARIRFARVLLVDGRDQRRRDRGTVALHDEADFVGPPPRAIARGSPRCCPCRRARPVPADVRRRRSFTPPRAFTRSTPKRRLRSTAAPALANGPGHALDHRERIGAGLATGRGHRRGPGRRRRHRPRDTRRPREPPHASRHLPLVRTRHCRSAQRFDSFRRERGS